MPTASRIQAAAVAREQRAQDGSFDGALDAPVEFAPTGPPNRSTSPKVVGVRRAPIAVGPGRPAIVVPAVPVEGGLPGAMPEFPIQLNKVQAPPLREQTLARDRLLDWLAAKIHDRVVLVIAEAGYGKTTLLADFSRRTRLRTLWYRLDRGDRDWVGFIAHLAAAVRMHVADFGPATAALLRETATTAPSRDAVLDTFVRELGELPPDASVLVLDDFHLVDDNADIRHMTRELLARAPDRLTFVFASRRVPPVPLARLRALGEVAELGTDDLRFDEAETDRLFRETYAMPLERGLIAELSKRTEGWAASLQLVRAALHDRDAVQARAFIGSLSGAEGHLYDYLAEEVIGDLPPALQDFLMRTSILETIDLELAAVAGHVSVSEAIALIAEAEQVGLLTRRGTHGRSQVRAHPLVTQFLWTRLKSTASEATILGIHRAVADAARGGDWRIAARHYVAAGDPTQARVVVAQSLDQILATGAYEPADALVKASPNDPFDPASLVLASRLAITGAEPERGLVLAEQALSIDPNSLAAALTLVTARTLAGDLEGAVAASQAIEASSHASFAQIARTLRAAVETSVAASIPNAIAQVRDLLELLDVNDGHFRGIAELSLANLLIAAGEPSAALAAAERASAYLQATSAGMELVSASIARVWGLSFLGQSQEARRAADLIQASALHGQRLEVMHELAWAEVILGAETEAERKLATVTDEIAPTTENGIQALLVRAELAIRRGDSNAASRDLGLIPPATLRTASAFEVRRIIAEAGLARTQADVGRACRLARAAREHAARQGAGCWEMVAEIAQVSLEEPTRLGEVVSHRASETPWALSLAAEWILPVLDALDTSSVSLVHLEASRIPERWRSTLRRFLDDVGSRRDPRPWAALLASIGTAEDLPRLRAVDRGHRTRVTSHARALARRLAPRVLVEDLGRVRVVVGDRIVEGTEIRRKVLALLCLLLSREGYSSTRDEVLDSLWPDLDPNAALNSLNQTVYFLRRVFEPEYRDDQTPGYVHQDGETIWLDGELIDSRSRQARELIRAISRDPNGDRALGLAELYSGKFALDFAYEDWVTDFREPLHASFLRVVEQTIRDDMSQGKFNRAIEIAERTAQVEPNSEEVQAALVRLYRLAGAHAAAAEQYGRYATNLRDLGVDPPGFDEVAGGSETIGTPAY